MPPKWLLKISNKNRADFYLTPTGSSTTLQRYAREFETADEAVAFRDADRTLWAYVPVQKLEKEQRATNIKD
jgi:hypothetical protein